MPSFGSSGPARQTLRRASAFVVVLSAFVACNSDQSAGTAFQGNLSNHDCGTGTQVVLVDPVPGTKNQPAGKRSITIASNGVIQRGGSALALSRDGRLSKSHPLDGPVSPPTPSPTVTPSLTPSPTPTPTVIPTAYPSDVPSTSPSPVPTAPIPFSSPAFYSARGFSLRPSSSYKLYVTSVKVHCTPKAIPGAAFDTAQKLP